MVSDATKRRDITRAVRALNAAEPMSIAIIAAGLHASGWRLQTTATQQPMHDAQATNCRVFRGDVEIQRGRLFELRVWLVGNWIDGALALCEKTAA